MSVETNTPKAESDIIRINVCGMMYETLKCTLERYPLTLLGNEELRKKYFVDFKNAYYFDRHRQSFEAILYYYQSQGSLIRPNNIPMDMFCQEITFFKLGDEELKRLQKVEGYIYENADDLEPDENDSSTLQGKVWQLFEDPESSLAAKLIGIFSVIVIIGSIIIFCVETLPAFDRDDQFESTSNGTNSTYSTSDYYNRHIMGYLYNLELASIIWFTFEYVVRLISSPNKWRFMKSFLNLIDLIAILPYFIIMIIKSKRSTPLTVLRIARLVRVFRVFKLSRHSMGLQILGSTLRASANELGMLIFFLMFSVIIFASAMYYAEHDRKSVMFRSIPDTFWFTVVTMTTVGYGDNVPHTLAGKFVGGLCAISGVLTIALVVPVIVTNFEFFYKRDRLLSMKGNKPVKEKPVEQISANGTRDENNRLISSEVSV